MKIHGIQNIKKTESLKPVQKQGFMPQDNMLDRVSFHSNPIEPARVLTKIIGIPSKEDFVKIDKIISGFSRLKTTELVELKNNLIKKNFEKLKTSGMQFKYENNREFCEYDNLLISSSLKNELKQNSLKIYALNKLLTTVDMLPEQILPLSFSIYEHPVDKSLRIIGDFTKEDLLYIKNNEKQYSSLDSQQIYEQKLPLLEKIKSYCKKTHLSDKDFRALKKLSIEYTAMNNVQKQKGLFTKFLERVLNSSEIPEKIKKGDNIEGLGLVTDRLKVDNKDSIIVFSKINKSYMLKMYNLAKLRQKLVNDGSELNTMNERAKILIQNEEKSFMAQIIMTALSPEDLKKVTGIEENKQSYYIRDFLNYDKVKNSTAAKIVALRMLKLLNDKQLLPVYLRAQAYHGSKHSPVNFYRYYGLTPISHTNEEIEKIISQNNGTFPNEIPVYFTLKNFDNIKDRFSNWLKIYSV